MALVKYQLLWRILGTAILMSLAIVKTDAQDSSTHHFDYSKKLKYEVGLSYAPTVNFGEVHPEHGTYHPLAFNHPCAYAFEIDCALLRKHWIVDPFFKMGKMNFYLQFTEPIDSSFTPYYNGGIINGISDTFQFYNWGFRIGRVGTIWKRFQYEMTLGLNENYISNSIFEYTDYTLVPISIDTFNHIVRYSERFIAQEKMLLKHHVINNVEIGLKIKYAIARQLLIVASAGYSDNPVLAFAGERYIYWINYTFLSLDGNSDKISSGIAYTRFNQFHYGIGLSYLF